MTHQDAYPSLHERRSELYIQNFEQLGHNDILISSIGGAGQSLIGNFLQEIGLNYVDPYTEKLEPDGSSHTVSVHDHWRRRLAATHRRDSTHRATVRVVWPRFVKNEDLPSDGFRGETLFGICLLVRDPRDALYSLYRFRHDFAKDPQAINVRSFAKWLTEPDANGHTPTTRWSEFYRQWATIADTAPRRTSVRFEDLKQRPAETGSEMLQAFQLTADQSEVDRAAELSTFESMRQHEDRVAERSNEQNKHERILRRGQVDEWREWMVPELKILFADDRLESVARTFGYDLGADS